MEITDISISLRDEDKLKAFVNVTFDGCFVVRGMKVIEGNNGLFVSMPSRKANDGTYRDVAHPINANFRELIEKKVLTKYDELIQSGGTVESTNADHF
jgi:stage V sporulation protein G